MARKFQFRLDVVRDQRRRTRDEAARVVSEKIGRVVSEQQRVEALSNELRGTLEVARAERGQARMEIAGLRSQQYYSTWLHGRMTETSAALTEAEAQLSVERAKLMQATAKLKAIEKLRERRWKKHQFEIRKEEQAITDEVAGQMVQRLGAMEGRTQ